MKMVAFDFKRVDFKVQLGQFSTIVDGVSIGKLVKILIDFGKNHGQKHLMTHCRSSCSQIFFKNVLKLRNINRTAPVLEFLLLNKVVKKRFQHRCFPESIAVGAG